MSTNIPEGGDIGIDKNGTVEIFNDRYRESIKFSLAHNCSMSILINVLNAPAFNPEMMIDELDRWLVLFERNIDDFKALPIKSQINET